MIFKTILGKLSLDFKQNIYFKYILRLVDATNININI